MAIPRLVRSRLKTPKPRIAAEAAPAPPTSAQVRTPVDRQLGKLWCWAAVGAGIHNVVKKPAVISQCEVAKKHLGHTDCCKNPPPAEPPPGCNVEAALNEVLDKLLVTQTNGSGTLPLPTIRSEILRGRPVACAIRFPPPRPFHFVVIDGYIRTPSETILIVRDPEQLELRMSYASLISNYRNEGAAWQWWYEIA